MRTTLTRTILFNMFFCPAVLCSGQGANGEVAMLERSNNGTVTTAEMLRFKEMLAKYQPLDSDAAQLTEVGNPDNSALFEVRIDIPELGQVQVTAFLFPEFSHEVDARYSDWLDHYAKTLKRYPLAHVRVEAHTDSVGTASSNMVLSELRALEVKNQLVQRGIPETRLVAVGLGERSPVASNQSAEGRSRNRRVEFHNYFPVERR